MLATLSAPVIAVRDGLLAVLDRRPAELPPAVALADAAALTEVLRLAELAVVQALGDVHLRGLHADPGAVEAARPGAAGGAAGTVGSWASRLPAPPPARLVSLAKAVPARPHLQAAVLAGALTPAAAETVVGALRTAGRHLDRPDGLIDGVDGQAALTNLLLRGIPTLLGQAAGGTLGDEHEQDVLLAELLGVAQSPTSQADRLEQALVLTAARLPAAHLLVVLGTLLDALLPAQLDRREADAHAGRRLQLREDGDGGWTVSGRLDAVTGELLQTALTAAASTDPDNPVDTAAWAATRQQEAGAAAAGGAATDLRGLDVDTAPAPAPRSRLQRQHDALRLLLQRSLGAQLLGTHDKVAPHLVVTVPADGLAGQPGALPASTDSGLRLPSRAVQALACDSRLTRMALDLPGRPVEVSHTSRTLKGHERRLLLEQWGHRCASATCTRPRGTPLVPHHAEAYARTGTTSLSTSIPVCEADHDHVHRGGRLLLRDGRLLDERGLHDPEHERDTEDGTDAA